MQLAGHLAHVIGHMRGDEPPVEQHAALDLEIQPERVRFLNRNDAIGPDLVKRVGDHAADFGIPRRHRRYLRHLVSRGNLHSARKQLIRNDVGGLLHTATQCQRIAAGGNGPHAFAHQRVGQKGCGAGTVAGIVVRRDRSLAHHFKPHAAHMVLRPHMRSHHRAVVRDVRVPLAGFGHGDVTSARPDGHADGGGELRHTVSHFLLCFSTICNVFRH